MSKNFTIDIKGIPSSIFPEVRERLLISIRGLLGEYGIDFKEEILQEESSKSK